MWFKAFILQTDGHYTLTDTVFGTSDVSTTNDYFCRRRVHGQRAVE